MPKAAKPPLPQPAQAAPAVALTDKHRKPRANPGPTDPRKRKAPAADAKTSDTLETGKNLTLGQWIEVFDFVEAHPSMTQTDVCRHFQAKGWKVRQSMLSKKLQVKDALRARALETPNALESKRPRVVTCPEVERALVLWFQSMESRGEVVSGPMLLEKRVRFENVFDVPPEQRLTGDGWITSFKKAYGIKEHRRHGEAGSVDETSAVEERQRLRQIIAQYPPEDTFNGDEGGLFAYALPDRGLSTKAISGKKQNKFRITVYFVCNATGTEKEPLMYIGKSAKPRCFKHISAAQRKKFYYRNNNKAWMTSILFEEWVKQFDRKMRLQKRKVLLLLDNFSAHSIAYEPTHVRIEFIAPNMTSRIQPLDAGVIRAFKAHYRCAFCMRALDADEAGDDDIWKLNLWEAMCMARDAWDEITQQTIANCWAHTGIMPQPASPSTPPVQSAESAATAAATSQSESERARDVSAAAWDYLFDFISNDVLLPEAEDALRKLLGGDAAGPVWRKALSIANDTECGNEARTALEKLHLDTSRGAQPKKAVHPVAAPIRTDIEQDLAQQISELARRKLIRHALTVDEFLDPVEEQHVGEGVHKLVTDEDILAAVRTEAAEKAAGGEESAQDSADDDDDPEPTHLPIQMMIAMCEQLEAACTSRGIENALILRAELLKVKRELRQTELKTAKQLTIEGFLAKPAAQSRAMDLMDVHADDVNTVDEPIVVE